MLVGQPLLFLSGGTQGYHDRDHKGGNQNARAHVDGQRPSPHTGVGEDTQAENQRQPSPHTYEGALLSGAAPAQAQH